MLAQAVTPTSALDARRRPLWAWVALMATLLVLVGCASGRPGPAEGGPALSPAQVRQMIDESIPQGVADRPGWVTDIYDGFTVQGLEPSHQNVCAVVAVIEQESNFRVNPVVPGLGPIAWKEIDGRAARAGGRRERDPSRHDARLGRRLLARRAALLGTRRALTNRLRVLRAERRWSQAELAERLGVSRQTVNAIETGRYDPSLPLAFAIAGVFNRRIEEIFLP